VRGGRYIFIIRNWTSTIYMYKAHTYISWLGWFNFEFNLAAGKGGELLAYLEYKGGVIYNFFTRSLLLIITTLYYAAWEQSYTPIQHVHSQE